MTETKIDTEIEIMVNTLTEAAKTAGWTVIECEDSLVLASRTVVGDRHVVCMTPLGEMFGLRSINDKPTDKTDDTSTILGWFIGSALRDAEHRGSQGEFTYLAA